MAASSATPVPYFSALFIKALETTYKSYQVSASRPVKYACLSVSGFISKRGRSASTGSSSTQVHVLVVYKLQTRTTHTHTPL